MPSEDLESPGTAARLRRALDDYTPLVDRLAGTGWDSEAYVRAADLFGRLRELAARLPHARVEWTFVLITHFELAQAIWDSRNGRREPAVLDRLHGRHREALAGLARRCAEAEPPPAS